MGQFVLILIVGHVNGVFVLQLVAQMSGKDRTKMSPYNKYIVFFKISRSGLSRSEEKGELLGD